MALLLQDGAFDDVVQGVDAIMHTASPLLLGFDGDPDHFISPAVNGTIGILKSATAHGKTVKRIIVTSSCAAVLTEDPEPRMFSEVDWNDAAIQEVQEKGINARPIVKYHASKTLAERAAWDFCEKNKATIHWDLVVVNPPYVFGPVLQEVASPSDLNATMLYWYGTVCKGAVQNDQDLAATG